MSQEPFEITVYGRDEHGRLMVRLPKGPRVSNENFLSELLAAWQASDDPKEAPPPPPPPPPREDPPPRWPEPPCPK